MPKLKTNRGAAKRFKRTGSGRYKHRQAYKNHILTKKTTKQKRHLRGMSMVHESHQKAVDQMMGSM